MNLTDLLLFFLSTAGLTFIIVHSTIMDKLGFRQYLNRFSFFRDLIKCSLCTGFWSAIFVSIFFFNQWNPSFFFAGSAFSFLFERLTILLDEKIQKIETERTTKNQH